MRDKRAIAERAWTLLLSVLLVENFHLDIIWNPIIFIDISPLARSVERLLRGSVARRFTPFDTVVWNSLSTIL